MKLLVLIVGIFLFSDGQAQTIYATEESKNKDWTFAYEIFMPSGEPKGVIISQHGSTRDGRYLSDGKARVDEFTTRIIELGTKKGYAVVAIDAFYNTDIKSDQKRQFPGAWDFAFRVKQDLSDKFTKFYYTGFSYGGSAVINTIDSRKLSKGNWNGVVATAPACGIVSQPVKVSYPILIIKGENDHYPVRSCTWYKKALEDVGNTVELDVVPAANHFFSSDGAITKGTAMNGCADDPVIRMSNGTFKLLSGKIITRKDIEKLCKTNQSASGKNRKMLDSVVQKTVDFFDKL